MPWVLGIFSQTVPVNMRQLSSKLNLSFFWIVFFSKEIFALPSPFSFKVRA